MPPVRIGLFDGRFWFPVRIGLYYKYLDIGSSWRHVIEFSFERFRRIYEHKLATVLAARNQCNTGIDRDFLYHFA